MSSHHSIFEDQARELYILCDEEKKGYILKDDMFRLKAHLPLTDQQLVSVFESLDVDGNGTLTFEEFILGFGNFLGANFDTPFDEDNDNQNNMNNMMDGAAQEHLDHLLERVVEAGLNDDIDLIKETWMQMQNNNPELLTDFERLIDDVIADMSKSKDEYHSLENVLKSKSNTYEEEMKHIYDDLDNQLKSEKERLIKEERIKELELKSQIESQIKEKDKLLQSIQNEHDEISNSLQKLLNTHCETNQERERLERERNNLEDKLKHTEKSLRDCQEYIEDLNKKSKQDKRKRARAAIEMTEGIALERENLVRQLDELKEINKQLLAEKQKKTEEKSRFQNFSELSLLNELGALDPKNQVHEDEEHEPNVVNVYDLNKKRGSILSSYFTPLINEDNVDLENTNKIRYNDSIIEEGESMSHINSLNYELSACNVDYGQDIQISKKNFNEIEIQTEQIYNDELGERSPPDGAGEELNIEREILPDKPERIYKVVLIGDSSVGKTSILKRFCSDEFKEDGMASTIGVDFQIRSMKVDGYFIALQLWDTAGQERFRSITSQYYRKADGVVLVYDITNEGSYINLRQWMVNVKDAVEDGTTIMVLANKVDKPEDFHIDVNLQTLRSHLISDEEFLFYKCSAKSGINIIESFESMAKILTKNENDDLTTSLKIEESQKKGCCGRK